MATPRTILLYGHEALRAKSQPITDISPAIRELADDMVATMRSHRGVGLAAQQIGHTEAILVIDIPAEYEKPDHVDFNSPVSMPLVMINPEITDKSGKQRDEEGCLSFPEIAIHLTRANEVEAAYTDIEGLRHTIKARGLLARAIQHELDHLNGVLIVDHMSPMQRASVAGKLRRLRAQSQS